MEICNHTMSPVGRMGAGLQVGKWDICQPIGGKFLLLTSGEVTGWGMV